MKTEVVRGVHIDFPGKRMEVVFLRKLATTLLKK